MMTKPGPFTGPQPFHSLHDQPWPSRRNVEQYLANEHAGVRNPSPPCQVYPMGIPGFMLAFVCPYENALSFQPWPRRRTYHIQWLAASRSRTGPTVLRSRTDTGNFDVPWEHGHLGGGFHRNMEVLCSGLKMTSVVRRGSKRTAVHRIEARSPVRTTIYDLSIRVRCVLLSISKALFSSHLSRFS